jgi:hypothetical protein
MSSQVPSNIGPAAIKKRSGRCASSSAFRCILLCHSMLTAEIPAPILEARNHLLVRCDICATCICTEQFVLVPGE